MIIITEKRVVQEKRVPATRQEFDKLKSQIETSPMLKKQLTVRMGDIPQYQFLYSPGWESNLTLFHAMELIAQENTPIEFVKSGESFTGFITYNDTGSKIWGVKMASFFDDKVKANRQLVIDLIEFVKDKMKTHESIEWWAERNNPANELYQKGVPSKIPEFSFKWGWDRKVSKYLYQVSKK